jgi:hypothetical protein
MHLPSGDHTIRLGGISEMSIGMEKHSNGTHSKNSTDANGHSSDTNEIRITCPQDQGLNKLLETILTAWTILIQRYQRDTFHQFSWGKRGDDGNNDTNQCVPTSELDLSSHNTADSLKAKLGNARAAEFTLDQGSMLFLNDGTVADVRVIKGTLLNHH